MPGSTKSITIHFTGFRFLLFIVILLKPAVSSGEWLSETRLSSDIMVSYPSAASQNDIALDSIGNIHVVWIDNRDHGATGEYEVYYRRYNPASGWGLETQLTDETVIGFDEDRNDYGYPDPIIKISDKQSPGIVVDTDNNLYVSYENTSDQTVEVLRCEYSPATDTGPETWIWDSSPQTIGSSGTNDSNPVLAAVGTDIHAVWRKLTGGHRQIVYAPYTSLTGWGSPQELTTAASDKKAPMIAADAAGNLHVVWSDDRDGGGGYEIYYMSKPAAGSWQTETRVTTAPAANALNPFIAADATGNLHLAWEDDRDGNFEIYYCLWDTKAVSPGWSSETRVTNEPADSKNPHLVVDVTAQLHLLWQDRRMVGGFGPLDFSLYYKKKAALWGDPVKLSRNGYRGSITADTLGNLHVVYGADFEIFDGLPAGNPEIYYLKFDPLVTSSPAPSEAVLVLDTSGSMGWRDDGSLAAHPTESRLYKAGQALSSFLDRFNLRNPTNASFGLVRFPNAAEECPSSETVIALTPLNEATRYDAIANVIPSLVAGGITPMADGMTRAAGLLSPAATKQMLLLVSDGHHNCPSTAFPGGFVAGFSDPIYTIGIGTAVEVNLPQLDSIATTTGGDYRNATTTTHLNLMSWLKTIIQSLFGLEAENDPAGVLEARKTARHESWITKHDNDIAFDISWATPKAGYIDFQLHTPEGDVITPERAKTTAGITHISRDTYQIYFLEEPFLRTIRRTGRWFLELSGKHMEPGTREPYHYSVLMNSTLKMGVELNRQKYNAGDPIALQVTVRDQGKAIPTDLAMTLYSPQQSLGNWMAKHPIDMADLKEKPNIKNGDTVSDLLRKALVLSDDRKNPFPSTQDHSSRSLYDDGTHGDLVPGDHVYTHVLTDTQVPGTYSFEIVARGKTSSGEPFRRARVLQRRLAVRATADDSILELKKLAAELTNADSYEVILTPKDALGNYLGPGFADRITFSVDGAVFTNAVQDRLDGSYTQRFRLPKSFSGKNILIRTRVLDIELAFCR
jgi:hypothetical protein